MSLIERLLKIDARLDQLQSLALKKEYADILKLKGTKFYLKLNLFEKKLTKGK